MDKGVNLIKNKHVAYYLAISLIIIALLIETAEFIIECVEGNFNFVGLFAYIFEIVTNGLLIFALVKKFNVLIELALVILKVFEATFYPMESCERLDKLLITADVSTFYVVTHVLFAVTAFSLLFALVFFLIYKLKDKVKYWDIMKIWVLLASFCMLVTLILYIIEINKNEDMQFEELLEPMALTILFLGMFMTYEYVEEEIIYNE